VIEGKMDKQWIDTRRLLWDDDEQILIVDDVRKTKPMKQAGKVTVQPNAQFCCGNSFRPGSTRRRDNVIRYHTWIIEFDDMPLDEQRRFWENHDLPHTMRVYSGNKSIHVYIRTVESIDREQWLSIAGDLKRIFPQADHKVLIDSARLSRLPNGMRVDVCQEVEARGQRIPLNTLVKWIESQSVIKAYRLREIEKKREPGASLSNLSRADKIRYMRCAEEDYQEQHPQQYALYQQLVTRRFKAERGKRNDRLIEIITFLHDSVCEPLAMDYARLFYDLNIALFNDPVNQHCREAAAHWENLDHSYMGRLSDVEAEIYDLIKPEERPFWRICRSLAYGDESPAGDLSFTIPMTHFGYRLNLDGQQVSRLIDRFITYGILARVEKGTQHRRGKDGSPIRGKAGIYRWIL
jgi:hypothetical protein